MKRGDKWLLIGSVLVCGAIFLAIVRHVLQERRLVIASVASECLVVSAKIASGDESSRSYPEVVLEHEVAGKTYRRTDQGPSEMTSMGMTVPKVGSRIRCHYVPGEPDLVTIYVGRPTHTGPWLGFGAFTLLLPLVIFGLMKWPKRS